MNKKLIFSTVLLHFMIVLVGISILPNPIPVHYNIAGQIDRMGSSLELLLLPCTSLLVTVVPFFFEKRLFKRNNSTFLSYLIAGLNVFFMFLSIQFIMDAYTFSKKGIQAELFIEKFTIPASGLLFILLGNYMPKVKNNNFIGLRTSWSMHNDVCWYHSQRLGGISFILLGFALLLICPFLPFTHQLLFFFISMITVLIIDTYGSYRIYQKYKDKEDLIK